MRKRTLGFCIPRIWTIASCTLLLIVLTTPATAQKFYPDDPLEKDPAPVATYDPDSATLASSWSSLTTSSAIPESGTPTSA